MAKVLVIDDDRMIREMVTMMLSEEGFQVCTFEEPLSALETLKQDTSFNLILLDMVMPKTSGLDVLRMLHEQSISLPVILFSGEPTAPQIIKEFQLEPDCHLPKPFTRQKLLDAIHSVL